MKLCEASRLFMSGSTSTMHSQYHPSLFSTKTLAHLAKEPAAAMDESASRWEALIVKYCVMRVRDGVRGRWGGGWCVNFKP